LLLTTILAIVAGLVVGAGTALLAETIMAHRRMKAPVCPYCQTPYERFQWSVTLAFLLARFRCRECNRPLRLARLAGELLLAATWGMVVARYGLNGRVIYAMLAVIPLQMVTVTDLETRLIPNHIILPATLLLAVIGLFFGGALPQITAWKWTDTLLGGLIGFGVFWVLVILGEAVFGDGALGHGDIKLAAYIGLLVGFPWIIPALILGILFGGVGGVFILLAGRGTLRTAIPYGPYLVLGGLTTLIWGVEITTWFLR